MAPIQQPTQVCAQNVTIVAVLVTRMDQLPASRARRIGHSSSKNTNGATANAQAERTHLLILLQTHHSVGIVTPTAKNVLAKNRRSAQCAETTPFKLPSCPIDRSIQTPLNASLPELVPQVSMLILLPLRAKVARLIATHVLGQKLQTHSFALDAFAASFLIQQLGIAKRNVQQTTSV